MRVVAGSARGRRLAVPRSAAVRPTTGRVREALMSALGPRLAGARVLDLFAGSGALAIEALSRGAAHATLVEREARAAAVVERNLRVCGFEGRARLVRADALAFLGRGASGVEPFDILLLDPPYGTDLAARVLARLARGGLLAPGAVVVLEHAPGQAPDPPPGLVLRRTVSYGDTEISYLDAGGPPPTGNEPASR